MNLKNNVRMLTTLSVLTAISIVLVILIHFPIFPAFNVLVYDPMDIPFLIAGFIFGPVAGLTVTAVACVIQGLVISPEGGLYGILMHFIASGTLVAVSSIIYKKKHDIKGAIIGLSSGTIAMAAIMIPANLLITSLYYNMPVEGVTGLLLPFIIPFNLIKAGINSVITFIIYNPLRKFVIKDIRKKQE